MPPPKKSRKPAAKRPAAKPTKTTASPKGAPKEKRSLSFRLARILAIVALIAIVIVCAIFGSWAQTFDMSQVQKMSERSTIYGVHGKPYCTLFGQNRVTVPLTAISPWFIKALLAREDTRFYSHHGVDFIGIARAVVSDVVHLSLRQGASTITQQLARNTYPLGGKTFGRKLLEMFVALRIERNYTKQQILEAYINRIYFGSGCFGAESASLAYFGKHVANLDLCESAMLVGLIRSPNRFSPINNLDAAYAQRDEVVARMLELKMITPEQSDHALHEQVRIAGSPLTATSQDNYARSAIIGDLELILGNDQLSEGGLKVFTTIDPQLQNTAQQAVDAELTRIEQRPDFHHITRAQFDAAPHSQFGSTPYLQGALVAIDNRTGGIRAIVGGRDYQESTFNRALLANRQIGSTFKPFVYATAFERGLSPNAPVSDGPVSVGSWHPHNDDHRNLGTPPASEGLILSRNTMSIRVGEYAGIPAVRATAAQAGLGKIPKTPAIFLGAFGENLKAMTCAYTIFPNRGVRRQNYIIERVEDAWGNTLYQMAHITTQPLTANSAAQTSAILEQVLDHGTAASARTKLGFTKRAAGKTGTTNNYHDAWFIGYTGSLTCGVWVGFDKPQQIMPRGFGATLALPIWVDFMKIATANGQPDTLPSAPREAPVPPDNAPASETPRRNLPGRIFQSFRNLFHHNR